MSRALITLDPTPIATPRRPLDIGSYEFEIDDGVICCGSDQHYRPDEPPSTAHRAFVQTVSRFAEEGTLRAVVLGVDAFDFPAISKHPRIMWEQQPSIAAEIAVVQAWMEEIKSVAGLACESIFIMGNHDQRLSSKISAACPELEGVHGMDLRDHLDPDWTVCWEAIANGPGINAVEFRHRHKSGHGAGRNNVLAAGRSVISGHTHHLNCTRVSNSLGHFWGVDTGTMAALGSKAFRAYTEMAQTGWASGFVVLAFAGGKLLVPEIAMVVDEEAGLVAFRGELISVGSAVP